MSSKSGDALDWYMELNYATEHFKGRSFLVKIRGIALASTKYCLWQEQKVPREIDNLMQTKVFR